MKLPTKLEKALNDQNQPRVFLCLRLSRDGGVFRPHAFHRFCQVDGAPDQRRARACEQVFKYITERGGKVALRAISEPKCDYKSPLEAYRASLAHEQRVSAAICGIYELATAEKDFPTLSFLKWFLMSRLRRRKMSVKSWQSWSWWVRITTACTR